MCTIAASNRACTHSAYDGEGEYYITAGGVTLGISFFIFHEEKMTFELAVVPSTPCVNLGIVMNSSNQTEDVDCLVAQPHWRTPVCTDDFYVAVHTVGDPRKTVWTVIDTLGGYSLPLAVNKQRTYFPDGSCTFNMLDDGGDGLCCNDGKGFVLLTNVGKAIVNTDGEFGAEISSMCLCLTMKI